MESRSIPLSRSELCGCYTNDVTGASLKSDGLCQNQSTDKVVVICAQSYKRLPVNIQESQTLAAQGYQRYHLVSNNKGNFAVVTGLPWGDFGSCHC